MKMDNNVKLELKSGFIDRIIEQDKIMNNYEITTGTYKEDLLDFNIIKVINARKDQYLDTAYLEIEASINFKNMIEVIEYIREKTNIKYPYTVHAKNVAEIYNGSDSIIGLLANFELHHLRIDIFGDPDLIKKLHKVLAEAFDNKVIEIKMSWHYSSGRGIDSADIPVSINSTPAKDSHYPFIKDGIDTFLEKYHNSTNTILLLTGEPGTGKTSFIRHYISKYRLDSMVTYDENVMNRDDFYISFLTSSKKHVLIVEDADLLLSKREDAENKIMSKFLNVSDGLVKSVNKKIIFSTNITQLNKIDPAVIRKGRCFDIVEFRKLTLDEANIINKDNSLSLFEKGEEFSLAEIFNRQQISANIRKIGF